MKDLEDKQIRELFDGFEPNNGGDDAFIERVEQNLRAVDNAREMIGDTRRLQRRAVVIAALVGFISGIASVLCYSIIKQLVTSVLAAADIHIVIDGLPAGVLAWAMICTIVTGLSYVAYDLVTTLRPRR